MRRAGTVLTVGHGYLIVESRRLGGDRLFLLIGERRKRPRDVPACLAVYDPCESEPCVSNGDGVRRITIQAHRHRRCASDPRGSYHCWARGAWLWSKTTAIDEIVGATSRILERFSHRCSARLSRNASNHVAATATHPSDMH